MPVNPGTQGRTYGPFEPYEVTRGAIRAFADAVAQSPAFTGQNTPDMARQVVWPALSALAFASAAALGLLTAVAGGTWSTMGSRYERRVEAAPAAPATEADIWKALDEGRDPTE